MLLPECALIAGLPQAPGVYNPFTNPDLAKQRQLIVLGLMEKQGYISHEERVEVETTPISYNPAPYPIEAPHFVWIVKDQIDRLTSEGKLPPHQSLIVRTTLDLETQYLAESVLKRRIEEFRQESGPIRHNVNNAALVLLSPLPNTTYRIDPTFDPSAQQLEIEVAAGQGISQVEIWMDGSLLTTMSPPPYETWWTLAAGEHRIWAQARAANGEIVKSAEFTITVLPQ